MKRVVTFITLTSLIFTTGCTNISGMMEMWKTKNAIKKESYATALIHAREAIREGYDDEEFEALEDILTDYDLAKDALSRNEPGVAKLHLEDVDDFEDSGMSEAIEKLMTEIEEAIFDDEIEEIENCLTKNQFYSANWNANHLLGEKWLTSSQRQTVNELLKKIEAAEAAYQQKKKSTSTPTPKPTLKPTSAPAPSSGGGKAILSKQEATEIARKALDVPASADVVVSTYDTYYIVSFSYTAKYGGETFEEEVGCKVDFNTGRVYDQMG